MAGPASSDWDGIVLQKVRGHVFVSRMICRVFLDTKLSVGYLKGAIYV